MNLFNILGDLSEINIYLDEQQIENLNNQLKVKQRTFLLTEKYFIKVGTSKEDKFYKSLLNEIKIYETLNSAIVKTPKLVEHFTNENCIMLIFERIKGHTLGVERNNFNIQVDIDLNYLFSEIINISKIENYPTDIGVLNRDIKAEKYFEIIHKELDYEAKKNMERLIGTLHQNSKLVFSHGDLIPTNIIKSKDSHYFIDWEWAALRPTTYDVALFMLFSDCPLHSISRFEKLDKYWDPIELYRDAIIISTREIKNWLEVGDSLNQKRYLKLWLDTLKEAERWLMLH